MKQLERITDPYDVTTFIIVSYKMVARTDQKSRVHSRVIWSCAWTEDDLYFFTASRDKKV